MDQSLLLEQLRGAMAAANDDVPLYRRLRGMIEALVSAGTLKPGDLLPGERILADALGLSRVTVRKAIETLVEEGRLHRRHQK